MNAVDFWYFVLCTIAGGSYFCISSYREERKGRKEAEARCKTLEQDLALSNAANERLLHTIEEMEEATEDAQVDYSIMAGLIEEHTQQFADVHKWMDLQDEHMAVHCQHFEIIDHHLAQPFQMQFIPMAQPTGDYCGPDEASYDPYPEPELPVLDSVKNDINGIEGLDTL